jgi:phage-related protein
MRKRLAQNPALRNDCGAGFAGKLTPERDNMKHLFKELEKTMSAFKDKIEADILDIVSSNGGETSDQVNQQIAAAIAPVTATLTTIQGNLQDTQDALTDLADKLASGDTAGAQAALQTAQTAVSSATTTTTAATTPAPASDTSSQ